MLKDGGVEEETGEVSEWSSQEMSRGKEYPVG